jgi:hypothetical protein
MFYRAEHDDGGWEKNCLGDFVLRVPVVPLINPSNCVIIRLLSIGSLSWSGQASAPSVKCFIVWRHYILEVAKYRR